MSGRLFALPPIQEVFTSTTLTAQQLSTWTLAVSRQLKWPEVSTYKLTRVVFGSLRRTLPPSVLGQILEA
jgi:uncharacterized protein (DUF2267 family)